MAVGLEMRSPLLDYRLIEFAFGRLPSVWKVRGCEGRRLQKRLGRRLLPTQLDIDRKQGFSIPINEWLRQGETSLSPSTLGMVINANEVKAQLKGHAHGRANGSRIYALLVLEHCINNLGLNT